LEPILAEDCRGILTITNNGQHSTNKGADASGKYPIGIHPITFVVTDSCGNTATCKTTVTVVDKKPPTPYCLSLIIVLQDMGPMGIMASLWAKDLNHKSWDDCCKDTLTYSFSGDSLVMSRIFTCADVGENTVEMWVIDCHGNKSFCKTKVIVQDNHGLCPPGDTMNITGTLSTVTSKPVQYVKVDLNGRDSVVDGAYRFDSLSKAKYVVLPTRDDDPLQGVSTADIVKIQRHILGVDAITNPYYLIAADVNKSGSITSADIAEIRKLILGVTITFANNSSWRFVPALYTFPDPSNPWLACPHEAVFNPLTKSGRADFIGIKIGDVNGTATGQFAGDDQKLTQRSNDFDLHVIDSLYNAAVAYEQRQYVLYAVPNPTTDQVNIVLPESVGACDVMLAMSDGRLQPVLYLRDKQIVTCSVEQYPAGVYTLVIQAKSGRYVARVIKL
jgi:hypothetical protein